MECKGLEMGNNFSVLAYHKIFNTKNFEKQARTEKNKTKDMWDKVFEII